MLRPSRRAVSEFFTNPRKSLPGVEQIGGHAGQSFRLRLKPKAIQAPGSSEPSPDAAALEAICSGPIEVKAKPPRRNRKGQSGNVPNRQGRSDGEVRQALVERFGHEVLMRPSFDARSAPPNSRNTIGAIQSGALLYATMRGKGRKS